MKETSSALLRRMLCMMLSLLLLFGAAAVSASADDAAYDFAAMKESSRTGTWGVETRVADGVLSLHFSGQYAEQRYDLPDDLDPATIQQVTVNVASGDIGKLSIKLLSGAEQADVVYGANTIQAEGTSFDGIGLMSLSETGGDYELTGITFTLGAAAASNADYRQLKELYADEFRMGVACEAISHWGNSLSEIGNPDKEALMLQEFNSMTFGNELKPAYNMAFRSREATETDLPFGHNPAAIEMLNWARDNGMAVRGHTLIWHSQCDDRVFCKEYKPVYLQNGNLDPECFVDAETMKLRMESYIHHVMEYMYANGYGNVIYAWDVVNEAIEPGANADNMRNSYWYQIIGSEFLYDAFKYAREASEKYSAEYASLYGVDPSDPEALKSIQPKLFYNDYNEFQANKRDAIIRAVKPIVADGYLDGIGMQGHLSDTTDIDAFITALNMYSEVVDEVHITELDVTESSSGVTADYHQGLFYNKFFSALLEARRAGAKLTCVTIWGLTDDNSWKKESSPLIFRGDLSPKPAYVGIANALTGESMPEPEYEAPDFSDATFTFNENSADAAELGFMVRGAGSVSVQKDVTYSGRGALLDTGRAENWHGVSFDVTRFIGQTIRINAWVKSDDSQVRLTADIDGVWPNVAKATTSDGTWKEIDAIYTVPADLPALNLYFETNGLADIYVDEMRVRLVGMDEGFESASNIATPRGVGHMPVLSVVNAERHSGGKALKVSREAQEATVAFNISKYVGKTVEVSAFVKASDETIRIGLVGVDDACAEIPAADGWTEVRTTFTVPAEWTSAQAYIETSGSEDYYVDDFTVRIGTVVVDLEDGTMPFSTRWQGAGKLEVITEEDGNHVARLTNQDAAYYGICYDVTPYLGMDVIITFDVKTDATSVKVTGDIDGVWPNYVSAATTPGSYKTVSGAVHLPSDRSALKVYIETPGTSDLYVDNFSIQRVF